MNLSVTEGLKYVSSKSGSGGGFDERRRTRKIYDNITRITDYWCS